MNRDDSGPLAIFGIRIKTIVILMIFIALLLIVINRSELESMLQTAGINKNPAPVATAESNIESGRESHLVVDEEMLLKAMQEVEVEKLTELESQDSTIPTDRFFYIVELHSGGDLEGIDLTVEPDHVILVSEGGTETKIERTAVKNIHRFKLSPSNKK